MIHVLRTRSPVYSSLRTFSLDLHVLGTPPAFVLSQDQTLQLYSLGLSAPVLTYFSQSIAVPQSASWTCYPVFKDRAYCTSDDQLPPRLATGRACYRCSRFRAGDAHSRPRSRPSSYGGRLL